jgi:hypothetical protein
MLILFYFIFELGSQHHRVRHGSLGQSVGHGPHRVEDEELPQGWRQSGQPYLLDKLSSGFFYSQIILSGFHKSII